MLLSSLASVVPGNLQHLNSSFATGVLRLSLRFFVTKWPARTCQVGNVYLMLVRTLGLRGGPMVPSCELCGRGMKGKGRNVVIEGASMVVCPECAAKFAQVPQSESRQSSPVARQRPPWAGGPSPTVHSTPPLSHRPRAATRTRPKPKRTGVKLDDMELVEDYAERIRDARRKMSLSQDELAQRVGERISTLQAIEAGRQKPVEKTIRGLERELRISLLEPITAVPIKITREHKGQKGISATLGDRVVVKRKMSQKARREGAQTK